MADTQHKPAAKAGSTVMLANILAIVGSIILVVIIIWGLIHLLSLSGGFLSSLFGGGSNKITISAPTELVSGQSVNISWKHAADESGMYALLYPCTEGLRFSTPGPEQAFVTMPCGAAYAVGQSTTSAVILPVLTGTSSVKTPFSVLFIPSSTSSKAVESTITLTVNPAIVAVAPAPAESTPAEPSAPTPEPVRQAATGPADLTATITSVNIDQYGNGTVIFNIANVGSSASGSYYFTAQLPTGLPYTYTSPAQSSLAAGSYIVNTLRFSQAAPGSIYINVDPANTSRESNEGNNTALQYLTGAYPYNYQYNQQYNYQPGYYDIYNYPYMY